MQFLFVGGSKHKQLANCARGTKGMRFGTEEYYRMKLHTVSGEVRILALKSLGYEQVVQILIDMYAADTEQSLLPEFLPLPTPNTRI